MTMKEKNNTNRIIIIHIEKAHNLLDTGNYNTFDNFDSQTF